MSVCTVGKCDVLDVRRSRTWSSGRPVSMIAGLSESAVRHQVSDSPSLVYTPPTGRQTVVNLHEELDTVAGGDFQAAPVTEVTSTGTNTTCDIVVTEDQATETGQEQSAAYLRLLVLCLCLHHPTLSAPCGPGAVPLIPSLLPPSTMSFCF